MRTRVDVDINIDRALVHAYVMDPNGDVYRELDRRMTKAQHAAMRFVGVKTGRLRATIRKQRGVIARKPAVLVLAGQAGRTGTRYLMAHHDGAPPHEIVPRRRQYLRFMVNGKVVFTKKVHHPGNKGTFFLTRALLVAGAG